MLLHWHLINGPFIKVSYFKSSKYAKDPWSGTLVHTSILREIQLNGQDMVMSCMGGEWKWGKEKCQCNSQVSVLCNWWTWCFSLRSGCMEGPLQRKEWYVLRHIKHLAKSLTLTKRMIHVGFSQYYFYTLTFHLEKLSPAINVLKGST